MAYNHEAGDVAGDFDDQMDYAWQGGYREGVDRVMIYIESIHRYDTLLSELRWAIKEGII